MDDDQETAVAIEYFRGSGENLEAIDAQWNARKKQAAAQAKREPDEFGKSLPFVQRALLGVVRWLFLRWWNSPGKPSAEETLFLEGKFKLDFSGEESDEDDDEEESGEPTPAQRAAWDQIAARGDAVWEQVMAGLVAEYRRQRPVRERWWRAAFGDFAIEHALPQVNDAAGMKKLVRPLTIRVKRAADDAASADVGIHFIATWNADGVVALIRGGGAVEIGPIDLIVKMKDRPGPGLRHPVFGTLHRIPDDDPWEVIAKMDALKPQKAAKSRGPYPWEGAVQCEALRDYFLAADDRAEFKFNAANADAPRSAMPWDFAKGRFTLRVYAPAGEEPTPAQADAWAAFKADEQRRVAEMITAIFDDYVQRLDENRKRWQDTNIHGAAPTLALMPGSGGSAQRKPGYLEELIPKLDNADGLRDRMWLKDIHVHPADATSVATIAFRFVCTWNSDGFAVHCRDGKVEKIGRWKSAEPKLST